MEKIESSTLQLSISKKFEANFRYLMSEINSVEWGGLVIYKITNSFFDKIVKIKLVDFVLMDIGTGAETNNDYEDDPTFVTMLMDYPNHKYGLIHSHTMQVFYSSTDEKEIVKNEQYYPEGYLSVVVNARGHILARLSKIFETKVIMEINHNDEIRSVEQVYDMMHYIETEININEETNYINERIAYLKARDKAKEKKAFKKSKNKKYFNNINNHMNILDDDDIKTMDEIEKMEKLQDLDL